MPRSRVISITAGWGVMARRRRYGVGAHVAALMVAVAMVVAVAPAAAARAHVSYLDVVEDNPRG